MPCDGYSQNGRNYPILLQGGIVNKDVLGIISEAEFDQFDRILVKSRKESEYQ